MKDCAVCSKPFTPRSSFQTVCKPACMLRSVRAVERQAKADKRAERAKDKERAEKLETIPELIAEADKAFGEYIRWRDRIAGHPCISSGRPLDWWSGNKVDCGHYRSKGAASHLRYNEDNAHAQTKQENRFNAGNAVDYRIHLIARIGIERVEALECNNAVIPWDRETLRQIKATYRAKTRALKKEQA